MNRLLVAFVCCLVALPACQPAPGRNRRDSHGGAHTDGENSAGHDLGELIVKHILSSLGIDYDKDDKEVDRRKELPEEDFFKWDPPRPCRIEARSTSNIIMAGECAAHIPCALGPTEATINNTDVNVYWCAYPKPYLMFHSCEVSNLSRPASPLVKSQQCNDARLSEGICNYGPLTVQVGKYQFAMLYCDRVFETMDRDLTILNRACSVENTMTDDVEIERECPSGYECEGGPVEADLGGGAMGRAKWCVEKEKDDDDEEEDDEPEPEYPEFAENVTLTDILGTLIYATVDRMARGNSEFDGYERFVMQRLLRWIEENGGKLEGRNEDEEYLINVAGRLLMTQGQAEGMKGHIHMLMRQLAMEKGRSHMLMTLMHGMIEHGQKIQSRARETIKDLVMDLVHMLLQQPPPPPRRGDGSEEDSDESSSEERDREEEMRHRAEKLRHLLGMLQDQPNPAMELQERVLQMILQAMMKGMDGGDGECNALSQLMVLLSHMRGQADGTHREFLGEIQALVMSLMGQEHERDSGEEGDYNRFSKLAHILGIEISNAMGDSGDMGSDSGAMGSGSGAMGSGDMGSGMDDMEKQEAFKAIIKHLAEGGSLNKPDHEPMNTDQYVKDLLGVLSKLSDGRDGGHDGGDMGGIQQLGMILKALGDRRLGDEQLMQLVRLVLGNQMGGGSDGGSGGNGGGNSGGSGGGNSGGNGGGNSGGNGGGNTGGNGGGNTGGNGGGYGGDGGDSGEKMDLSQILGILNLLGEDVSAEQKQKLLMALIAGGMKGGDQGGNGGDHGRYRRDSHGSGGNDQGGDMGGDMDLEKIKEFLDSLGDSISEEEKQKLLMALVMKHMDSQGGDGGSTGGSGSGAGGDANPHEGLIKLLMAAGGMSGDHGGDGGDMADPRVKVLSELMAMFAKNFGDNAHPDLKLLQNLLAHQMGHGEGDPNAWNLARMVMCHVHTAANMNDGEISDEGKKLIAATFDHIKDAMSHDD